MQKKLILFDIDGTLLYSGKGARKSLCMAIENIFKVKPGITTNNTRGRTDKLIIREILTSLNISSEFILSKTDAILNNYLKILKTEYNKNNDAVLFPGVYELLDRLKNNSDACLGLLTGNIEKGAQIKLSPFQLNEYFPIGAFGSDAFYRDELPAIAVRKAEIYYNMVFKGKNIVIIGDTEFDVSCGKNLNVKAIAICRNPKMRDIIMEEKPDNIFEGFEQTEEIVDAIFK